MDGGGDSEPVPAGVVTGQAKDLVPGTDEWGLWVWPIPLTKPLDVPQKQLDTIRRQLDQCRKDATLKWSREERSQAWISAGRNLCRKIGQTHQVLPIIKHDFGFINFWIMLMMACASLVSVLSHVFERSVLKPLESGNVDVVCKRWFWSVPWVSRRVGLGPTCSIHHLRAVLWNHVVII